MTKRVRHSKVMTIANRLVKEGYTRSMAMVKAWILVKLPQLKISVKGVTFGKRQKALEHLKRYNPQLISITLERESNNPIDSNAVKVIVTVKGKGSYCMGYLPSELALMVAPLIDKGTAVQAEYDKVNILTKCLPYGLSIKVRA